jgi:hypothetical protein
MFGSGGRGVNVGGYCGGGCYMEGEGRMVSSGRWACCLDPGVCEGYHPRAHTGALVATYYGGALVADGTVDLR